MSEQKKNIAKKIVELMKDAQPEEKSESDGETKPEDEAKPEEESKPNKKIEPDKPVIEINGGDNSINVADNSKGTINVNHHHKPSVTRNVVQPTSIHITEAQAKHLHDLVSKAVEIEMIAGGESKKMYSIWWGKVRKKYNVSSYKLIPVAHGESAIIWMQQQVAMLRPKLRRKDNELWRNEHYAAIYARWRELGYEKSSIYACVAEKLGKSVETLTALGERDLKRLYDIIMKM